MRGISVETTRCARRARGARVPHQLRPSVLSRRAVLEIPPFERRSNPDRNVAAGRDRRARQASSAPGARISEMVSGFAATVRRMSSGVRDDTNGWICAAGGRGSRAARRLRCALRGELVQGNDETGDAAGDGSRRNAQRFPERVERAERGQSRVSSAGRAPASIPRASRYSTPASAPGSSDSSSCAAGDGGRPPGDRPLTDTHAGAATA